MKKYIPLFIIALSITLTTPTIGKGTTTIQLKNGDKIVGTITNHNTEKKEITIQTKAGTITIQDADIKQQYIRILFKDGSLISGNLLNETKQKIDILTLFGKKTFFKKDIDSINALNRLESAKKTPYYYGDIQLTDLFFDPTGYCLAKDTLYISGLSVGFGFTDKLQISTNYWRLLGGDMNLRPKYMLYQSKNVNEEQYLAIGGHIHSQGLPWQHSSNDNDTESSDPGERDNKMWGQLFAAYTYSKQKSSGTGRIDYTIGSKYTYYNDKWDPRVYAGIAIDLRKDFKLITEVFYDPAWESPNLDLNPKYPQFDLGLLYKLNNKLRLGFHLHAPFIVFYYKL